MPCGGPIAHTCTASAMLNQQPGKAPTVVYRTRVGASSPALPHHCCSHPEIPPVQQDRGRLSPSKTEGRVIHSHVPAVHGVPLCQSRLPML